MNTRRSPPSPTGPADDAITCAVPGAPITAARPVRAEVPGVRGAGTPRADTAPSTGAPGWGAPVEGAVLQAHVAYFDRGDKGYIIMADTYSGFRKIGFGVVLSAVAAIVIASSFAWPATTGWRRPSLSVSVARIHASNHGSDSGAIDHEGRFVPACFDAAFTRAAGTTAPGAASALTWRQIRTLLAANRVARDPFGWTAAFLEWGALFYVAAQKFNESGPWLLTRERARAAMDGTLWPVLEREAAERRAMETQKQKGGGGAARLVRRHEE